MNENYYAVIMAGGGGTRLWPLSRKDRPKQTLNIGGERSLFQLAVDRLQGLFTPERILVVTVEEQAHILQGQCPEIPRENFLLESMPRGTAAVVGFAAAVLNKINPDAVMAVLTADHIIGNLKLFQSILSSAYHVAVENYLVTLGVTPTYPATGYGYIRKGKLLGKYQGLDVYQVVNFTEKPNLEDAENMFSSGEFVWNSGMFIWRSDVILKEINRQMPELFSQISTIQEVWDTEDQVTTIEQIWPEIKPQTIDFGIMENADQVAVIPAEGLQWNDVGSWEALFDVLPVDQDGNIIFEMDHLSLDTKASILFGTDQPKTVVTIGVEDLIVVDTGDVLLICKREQAQQVRQIVDQLKEEGRSDLL
jgi:mannose-1-phosphate guanylyltransferase